MHKDNVIRARFWPAPGKPENTKRVRLELGISFAIAGINVMLLMRADKELEFNFYAGDWHQKTSLIGTTFEPTLPYRMLVRAVYVGPLPEVLVEFEYLGKGLPAWVEPNSSNRGGTPHEEPNHEPQGV